MDEAENIRQSRKAKIWKDTGDLTGLGHMTGDLKLDEQLKVHLALKVMRKAYTKGSRVARAREKLQKEVDIDRLFNSRRKKKPKKDKLEGLRKYFHDSEPISTKTLQDLMKEAKISSGLARDKRKTEEESKKYGQLRRICPDLIEEIKREFSAHQAEMEMQKTENDPGRNTMLASMNLARPRSAQIKFTNRNSSIMEAVRGRVRPSTASSVRSSVVKERSFAFVEENDDGKSDDEDIDDDLNFGSPENKRSPTTLTRLNSSGMFNVKSIQDDERIMKALKLKEKLALEKEEQLKKKILDREQNQVLKQENLMLLEKKKAWLILGVMLKYLWFFYRKIVKHRSEQFWSKQQSVDRKAAMLIHKWWMSKKIWLILRRNPRIWQTLATAFLRFRFRMVVKRKKRSADLIVQFLRDSSGLSESVRRIYAFRQHVIKIQRWVRSWSDIQIYRVRVLWQAAEKIGRRINRQHRIMMLNSQSSSMKALKQVSGFSETVTEIDLIKRRIGKVLEYQVEASKNRQELEFQIKQLNLPDDPVPSSAPNPPVSSNAHHTVANRRRPILQSLPSTSINIPSADSFYEHGGDESPMHYSSNYVSNMNRFMNNNGGHGGLNSSFGLNLTGGSIRKQSKSNQSHQLIRKHSFNSVASTSQDDNKDQKWYLNPNNNSQDVFNADMRQPAKRAFQKKGQIFKSTNRLGGYSLVTLGVVDRFGASDPDLSVWLKKVRSNGMNIKLYELLRGIVAQQRKNYLDKLSNARLQRKLNPVNANEVVAFLRNPSDYSKAKFISEMVNVKYNASTLPDLVHDMRLYPFLLLTGGGLEAIETALSSNKFKFS